MTDTAVPTTTFSQPPSSLETERTRLGRSRHRGTFERDAVHAVLDAALVCHVGVTAPHGPLVLPTVHGREGDTVYLHGSVAARWFDAAGTDVCLTATVVDGVVLARSGFHHSMNYRSVVVLGRARAVTEPEEVERALRVITDHVVPGRWDAVRAPNRKELAGTAVLALDLVEASMKTRSGPPVDEPEDHGPDAAWAGVLPVATVFGDPVPDDDTTVEVPSHVTAVAGRPTTERHLSAGVTPST
ncbi:pyridoxamine 5'-phosphate oxidase family protein [Thalassiella azotivora]